MNYKFKTKPYGHQLDALEASWDKENFAYFMEMGTGKSKVLLDNAAVLYDKGLINGLLLIAPKGVLKIGMTQKYLHIYQITLKKKLFFGRHLTNLKNNKKY